ncbi:MAG: SGNH/GDSL hydrolase family protein [Clostridia bacterium]|nr:SGNH/GDSL hydrolase family protein [Clostridia bacterium]
MKNITDIDKNFVVETNIQREGIKFYDAESEPFKIYGVFKEDGLFVRLPKAVAKDVNEGVNDLNRHTAGGRIRFRTTSPYVALVAKMNYVFKMPHFALTGSAGFDIYVKEGTEQIHVGTFRPVFEITDTLENIIDLGAPKMREITIHFPLYAGVNTVYLGLDENAEVLEPVPYKHEKPVVYYGSSITQGGCASRPGNAYQSMISRRLDCDHVNLGFSGSARGEELMAKYISGLDMSVFVYDYDHNAPTLEHLRDTHERMFKIIRENNPELPIIMMPRPRPGTHPNEVARFAVIKATYDNAVAAGDKNVYIIDGAALCALCGAEGTVDTCHPNDWGFASMAKAVGDVLEGILK